jgi:hypothetical protein
MNDETMDIFFTAIEAMAATEDGKFESNGQLEFSSGTALRACVTVMQGQRARIIALEARVTALENA